MEGILGILGFAVFVGLLVMALRWLFGVLPRAFERFAKQFGLTYTKERHPGFVRGRFEGREIELKQVSVQGVAYYQMTVFLQGMKGAGLNIGQQPAGRPPDPGYHEHETGDEDFDRRVWVHVTDDAVAQEYLTPDRRDALTAAVTSKLGRVFVDDEALIVRFQNMRFKPEKIADRFRQLIASAVGLDREA